jgi:Thioredoxin-related protein
MTHVVRTIVLLIIGFVTVGSTRVAFGADSSTELYSKLAKLPADQRTKQLEEGARKEGKRFVIMWELRGCPYCKETHLVNFAQPRISDYVKANFEVLQLNIIGSRKVTDFDGTELSEKELAAKYGVRFTPTFQFFAEAAAPLKNLPPAKREVARSPGYLLPDDFLAMFRYVREKAYESKSFRDYLKALPS